MPVADASRIVTSMMAQFQASASELSDYVDKLAKTSAVSKTSIEQLRYAMAYVGTAARSANQPFSEVVSAIGALSTAGVESSQAGTTLRDMLTDLTDTTSYSSRKLQGLGFNMAELNPRANSLSSIIGTLRARGVDAADAMAIFGVRGGLAAGSLITVYKQYMDVLNAVQNQSKGTAEIMQQDVTNNLRKDLDKLAASWDYLVNRIFKSGLGDTLRQYTQDIRDLVIEFSDLVDTLSNANKFGALAEIAEVGLKYGFAVATNYLGGALTTLFQIVSEVFISRMKILGQIQFWRGVIDVIESVTNVLQAGFRAAGAELLDTNQKFATDIVATMMYAGDVFADKLTKAKTIFSVADSRYFAAKVKLDLAQADVDYIEKVFGGDLRQAQQQLYATPADSKDAARAKARFDYTATKYGEKMSEAIKDRDSAITGLEIERKRIGIGDYTGKREDFLSAAADAVGDISSQYKKDAAADMQKAKETLPKAAMALFGMITKDLGEPIIKGIQSFKPMDLADPTQFKKRLDQLLKENAPTIPTAPTKTLEKVTTGKVGAGVGPIELPKAGGTGSRGPVVSSMVEVGGGIASYFGEAGPTLEDATVENTKATRELTAAITGGPGNNISNVTKKPAYKVTESEMQTDLAYFARTGRMTERLKAGQAERLAPQVEAERAAREEAARDEAIRKQRADRARIENITSTVGLGLELGTPFRFAAKYGTAAQFDEEGRAVNQPMISLGQGITKAFGYTATAGDISAAGMLDVVGQIRRGVRGTSENELSSTPTTFSRRATQNFQTIKPLSALDKDTLMGEVEFDGKNAQRQKDLKELSRSLQIALEYYNINQELRSIPAYPRASTDLSNIDELKSAAAGLNNDDPMLERLNSIFQAYEAYKKIPAPSLRMDRAEPYNKNELLNAPALPTGQSGVLTPTLTTGGGLSANMPDVSTAKDTGPKQVALLSTIQSVLQSIDRNTKSSGTSNSNTLSITIA
jgi:TP901 family phage tail tape measure protein